MTGDRRVDLEHVEFVGISRPKIRAARCRSAEEEFQASGRIGSTLQFESHVHLHPVDPRRGRGTIVASQLGAKCTCPPPASGRATLKS